MDNRITKEKGTFLTFIKSFNKFELIWLASVVVLLSAVMIFLPNLMFDDSTNTLIVVCSVVSIVANPICELMISKQSRYNFLFSIAFIEITEMIIYLSLNLYSCALVSLLFWVPIDLVSFFKWKKNTDEEDDDITKVKRLNWWQDILIIVAIAVFSFVVGWLLSLLPECEDSYLDAFVSALGMANGILLLLRYNEQWYAWFAYLIFDAVLWIISGHYVMLITVVAMMINTVYGFVKWIKYVNNKKKHEKTGI
jgi:nicotinamide mononucleotide transporter